MPVAHPPTHTQADQQTHTHYIVLLLYYFYNSYLLLRTTLPQPPNVEMAPNPRGLDDVERHRQWAILHI